MKCQLISQMGATSLPPCREGSIFTPHCAGLSLWWGVRVVPMLQ